MAYKLGKTYNLKSFDDARAFFEAHDSAGGTVLARNLEYVQAEVFEQRIPNLTFLTGSDITVDNSGGFATVITKRKKAYTGDFADAGDNTNTTGKISIKRESDTIPVFDKEASSDWSELDLGRAELEGINLVSEFLRGHDQKYKENIDKIGYLGNGTKTEGLLNFSGFQSTASGTDFLDPATTGLEMYTELKDLINTQRGAVLNDEMFSANKVALHPDTYNAINSTYLDTSGSRGTVKEEVERTLNVTFVQTPKAKISGVYRMVAYSTFEQGILMRIPRPLSISNVYNKGKKFYVESNFSIAGLDVAENGAAYILTGV